jgi:hypothetical protein
MGDYQGRLFIVLVVEPILLSLEERISSPFTTFSE